MPPPQLARDGPRLDILQPVEIDLAVLFGHDAGASRADSLECRFDDFCGVDEPLVGQHRLDHYLGTVAIGLGDRFGLDQRHEFLGPFGVGFEGILAQARIIGPRHHGQAFGSNLGHHKVARRVAVKPAQMVGHKVQRVGLGLGQNARTIGDLLGDLGDLGIGRTIGAQMRARVHQAVAGDAVSLGHAVIVEIMRTRDLDRARAESRIGVFIGDDRDQAAVFLGPHRNFTEHPYDGRIAFITRMHRYRAIAQHGFGPRRGDGDVIARLAERHVSVGVFLDIFIGGPTGERIFEVPHMARGLDILDLEIGDGGFEMRVPIHQPLAAIDVALVIHIDEDLDHGVVEIPFLARGRAWCARHGEGLARPIARRPQPLELVDDGAARLLFPRPDMRQEFLAAHVAAGFALFGEFTLDHHLRGDARMIGAGLPERVEAAHAVPADQHILQRVVEGMAHMQNARNIGRWDHDGIGFCPRLGIGARFETALGLPLRGDACLGCLRVKALVHGSMPLVAGFGCQLPNGRSKGKGARVRRARPKRPVRRDQGPHRPDRHHRSAQ